MLSSRPAGIFRNNPSVVIRHLFLVSHNGEGGQMVCCLMGNFVEYPIAWVFQLQ